MEMVEYLLELDANILLWIQEYIRNDILTPFFTAVTRLGDAGMIWILVSAALLLSKKTRKIGVMGFCALIFSVLLNNLCLKNLVARTRPYESIEGLIPLVRRPRDFSFPSGHAASSFCAAGVFVRKLPQPAGGLLLLLAILISLSRLYVGVHFPSDVIVGVADGLLLSCLAQVVVEKYWRS